MRRVIRVRIAQLFLGLSFVAAGAGAQSPVITALQENVAASHARGLRSSSDQEVAGGEVLLAQVEPEPATKTPTGIGEEPTVQSPTPAETPEDAIGSGQAALISVAGECSFSPDTAAFSAAQSGASNDHLLDIRFENCHYERTDDGLDILSFDTRWQFDLAANVDHCSALSAAFLFEIFTDTAGLAWGGLRTVVSDLPLRNLSGNDQNAAFFQLFSAASPTPLTVASVLPARTNVPNFDHVYWGHVVLLKEPVTAELGKAIQHHLPVVGSGNGQLDYNFKLKVQIAEPRGWCFAPVVEGAPEKRANLIFTVDKGAVK